MDERSNEMDAWLGALATTLGVDPLTDDQVMELLGVALTELETTLPPPAPPTD